MEISGHKTRAIFDRYHIVSSRRLKELGRKMEAHLTTLDSSVLDRIWRLYKIENNGEPGGTRTRDHRIKSASVAHHSSSPCSRMRNLGPIILHGNAPVSS